MAQGFGVDAVAPGGGVVLQLCEAAAGEQQRKGCVIGDQAEGAGLKLQVQKAVGVVCVGDVQDQGKQAGAARGARFGGGQQDAGDVGGVGVRRDGGQVAGDLGIRGGVGQRLERGQEVGGQGMGIGSHVRRTGRDGGDAGKGGVKEAVHRLGLFGVPDQAAERDGREGDRNGQQNRDRGQRAEGSADPAPDAEAEHDQQHLHQRLRQ